MRLGSAGGRLAHELVHTSWRGGPTKLVDAIHNKRSGPLALHELLATTQSLPPYSAYGATGD